MLSIQPKALKSTRQVTPIYEDEWITVYDYDCVCPLASRALKQMFQCMCAGLSLCFR